MDFQEFHWLFYFREVDFYLIDVIAKKIKVVNEVATALGLKNVKAEQKRAELVKQEFDFIVSRAVTNMTDLVSWVDGAVSKKAKSRNRKWYSVFKGGRY